MTNSSIEKDIEKVKQLGLLKGKVIEIECLIDDDVYLRFKEMLNKYNHIKEEDILACAIYNFMENHINE